MEKRLVILCKTTVVSVAAATALLVAPQISMQLTRGASEYHIVLNSSENVVTKDEGYLHQVDVKGTKIDMIGYSSEGGAFGSVKKAAYGDYEFNGMVYNRSVINGFSSLKVTFSGGDLHYVFTDFLMQDMNFDSADVLESDKAVEVPAGKAYFLIYNESETPVSIDAIDVSYSCDGSIDSQMIYNQNTKMGGARSLAKRTTLENGFVELENDPLANNNNYSTGSHGGHADSWYRWNGRYFAESANLGTEFRFGMTIIGNISQAIDPNKFFHYNVWPQFTYGDGKDAPWTQIYIGNDNYEPHGKDGALRPSDPYVDQSYAGRFFSDYVEVSEGVWAFGDPDELRVHDGSNKTLREAYETYPLPFWFLEFNVYLNEDSVPLCDIFINGFRIYAEQEIFDNYDTVNKPAIRLKTLPMHLVNYGVDDEGTPGDSYVGSFTYPRLIG